MNGLNNNQPNENNSTDNQPNTNLNNPNAGYPQNMSNNNQQPLNNNLSTGNTEMTGEQVLNNTNIDVPESINNQQPTANVNTSNMDPNIRTANTNVNAQSMQNNNVPVNNEPSENNNQVPLSVSKSSEVHTTKGTYITMFFVFAIGLAFIFFLPNITSFISDLGKEEKEIVNDNNDNLIPEVNDNDEDIKNDEENTENEENTILKALDLSELRKEVSGDLVCVASEASELFALDIAQGYYFENDKIVKIDSYMQTRYADEATYVSFDVASMADVYENKYNSYDGIEGTTTLGNLSIINHYVYDLKIFDPKTVIDFGDGYTETLDLEVNETVEKLKEEAKAAGMTCTE